ncbi:hypothetical protein NDU88_004754 [Pleurodeles waltl]|uniref:Serpin domain-containing protein n=1 Tax=Pleurodeles waltl TaxID=8319 RepID=A0AAV7VKU2_PLEWA|nr:hypothetical protein NDU88_004754 [Pleurodeles waltl]
MGLDATLVDALHPPKVSMGLGTLRNASNPFLSDFSHVSFRARFMRWRLGQFSLIQEINMEELNSANSEFCFKRYKEIAKSKKHENIFFSPLSIMSAMGMVYRGASGNTATQMGEVLIRRTLEITYYYSEELLQGPVRRSFKKFGSRGVRFTSSLEFENLLF